MPREEHVNSEQSARGTAAASNFQTRFLYLQLNMSSHSRKELRGHELT